MPGISFGLGGSYTDMALSFSMKMLKEMENWTGRDMTNYDLVCVIFRCGGTSELAADLLWKFASDDADNSIALARGILEYESETMIRAVGTAPPTPEEQWQAALDQAERLLRDSQCKRPPTKTVVPAEEDPGSAAYEHKYRAAQSDLAWDISRRVFTMFDSGIPAEEIIPPALEAYERLLDLDLEQLLRAKIHRFIGEMYHMAGDIPRAIEYFELALSYHPQVGVKRILAKLKKELKERRALE